MSIDIADFDFLEAAHVFVRPDGREARFLFLTNTALPAKLKKVYPPQVVYADENDNILSCSIERFLANRKFTHVDPELENRLLNLLAAGSSDSADEDSLDLDDELSVTDDSSFDPSGTDDEDAEPAEIDPVDPRDDFLNQEEVSSPIVTFHAVDDRPSALDALYLAQAVQSYQETPNLNDGSIQHTLFVRAAPGITRELLSACFTPSETKPNTIFTFSVNLPDRGPVLIDWDNFAGVYSAVFFDEVMFQIIFIVTAETMATQAINARLAQEAGVQAPVEVSAPVIEIAPTPAPAPAPVQVAPAPVTVQTAPQTVSVSPVVSVQPQPSVSVAVAPAQ